MSWQKRLTGVDKCLTGMEKGLSGVEKSLTIMWINVGSWNGVEKGLTAWYSRGKS